MKRYVIGFLFSGSGEKFLLIRKDHPEWQAGALNGIGGKIEPGETPIESMIREFKEETGQDTTIEEWKDVLTLKFSYAEIEVFAAINDHVYLVAESTTSEAIERFSFMNLMNETVVNNLLPLLQLSYQKIFDNEGVAPVNWQQEQKEDDHGKNANQ